MLSEKIFKKGLGDLKSNFDSFKLTEDKVKLWYGIVKDDVTDEEWQEMVFNCIVHCHRVPSLADVVDLNDYYTKGRR